MDDVIYEEFKGTGNSELILDRKLAEKRIFPAIDVQRSGTRREELLLEEGTLKMVWTMRRMLSAVGTNEGIELLLNRLAKTEQQRPVPGHADQAGRRGSVARGAGLALAWRLPGAPPQVGAGIPRNSLRIGAAARLGRPPLDQDSTPGITRTVP